MQTVASAVWAVALGRMGHIGIAQDAALVCQTASPKKVIKRFVTSASALPWPFQIGGVTSKLRKFRPLRGNYGNFVPSEETPSIFLNSRFLNVGGGFVHHNAFGAPGFNLMNEGLGTARHVSLGTEIPL